MNYQDIVAIWQSKQIKTAADIACEMNGNGVAFIYHSAKIENDRITYHDTREIFDHGGVTGYTGDVRSLFEIQNSVAAYYRMLDAFEKREPLSEGLICELQGLLTQGTYDTLRYQKGERPGVYKKNDYVTGAQEVGALPEDVPEELGELVRELADVRPEQALTAAAYFHAKFENIHPFADGNGRTGRLWHTLLLSKWNPVFVWLPVESIVHDHQEAYYEAINASNAAVSSTAFIEFMLAAIKTSLIESANMSDRMSDAPKDKTSERWKEIERFLENHDVIQNADVRQNCGVSAATANRILSKLAAEGKLVKCRESGHWAYRRGRF